MVKCLECYQIFNDEGLLHRHLRSHDLKIASYYYKHFPRHDLLTHEFINFTDKEHYFNHNFNSRDNFKKWFHSQKDEILQKYCKEYLSQRKLIKGIYAPCQVVLRTLECPSILGFDRLFGDYYSLCYQLGFNVVFERWKSHLSYSIDPEEFVYIDTREQNPLSFKNLKTQVTTLDVGDYAFGKETQLYNIFIERKSLPDFINSFGRDIKRITKEMERAKMAGKRIVVVVEIDLKFALIFNKLPWIPKIIKVTPEYVFHNVRTVLQNFHNVQFLFAKNRFEASRIIEYIFRQHGDCFKYDLQLALDMGLL